MGNKPKNKLLGDILIIAAIVIIAALTVIVSGKNQEFNIHRQQVGKQICESYNYTFIGLEGDAVQCRRSLVSYNEHYNLTYPDITVIAHVDWDYYEIQEGR